MFETAAPFDNLSGNSRIWIFSADKEIREDLIFEIEQSCSAFVETWTAHNKELRATCLISKRNFLVFAVDENFTKASGCSIDKLNHFIRTIEQQFGIKLGDRFRIVVEHEGTWQNLSHEEFKNGLQNNIFDDHTKVCDPLVQNLDDFRKRFEVSFSKSWFKNYFGDK